MLSRRLSSPSLGTADDNLIDLHCRLAHADRHGLAILTAHAYALIEGKIIAHHGYPGHHFGAIDD
jgi:hypothetical protein